MSGFGLERRLSNRGGFQRLKNPIPSSQPDKPMKAHTAFAPFAAFIIAASHQAAATTLTVNNTESGRVGNTTLAGNDWAFGTAAAGTAADASVPAETLWSNTSALIGDNPTNIKFAQMWCFDITQAFIDDVADGATVTLEFSTANINNGGGAPGDVAVQLLSNNLDRVTAAQATPLATLGTISGTTANTPYVLDVTNLPALTAGDRLWFGLNDGLSSNSAANNINMNKSGALLVATPVGDPPVLPALLAEEFFDYPDSTNLDFQNGGTGWTSDWVSTAGEFLVTAGEAVGQNARLPGDTTTNALDIAFRSHTPVNAGTFYVTFTGSIAATSHPDDVVTSGISLFAGATEWSFLGFRNDFFRLDGANSGNANDRDSLPGSATANTPTRFVLEVILDPASGAPETFNAYMFPDNVLPAELPAVPTLTTSYDIGTGVALDQIRIFDNNYVTGSFDNLVLGTEYSAIVGDAPPTNIAAYFDGGGNFIIDFRGKAETDYEVKKSADLTAPFVPLTVPLTITTDAAGLGQAIVPASEASEPSEFYRLEESAP
jgi:hypothetical protein